MMSGVKQLDKIVYSIEIDQLNTRDFFDASLDSSSSSSSLNLIVTFKNEAALLRAHTARQLFDIRVKAHRRDSEDAWLHVFLSVHANPIIYEPLSFEQPMYAVSLESEATADAQEDLPFVQPRLKQSNKQNIVFSLFQSGEKGAFPFLVDTNTGAIRLERSRVDENMFLKESVFSFSVKATYKKLLEEEETNAGESYFRDYMIPAFAKVQVSFKLTARRVVPEITGHILSPLLTRIREAWVFIKLKYLL